MLDTALTGTGTGSISSNPAGITCGTTCSATYPSGTVITLTATAASSSDFTGWIGGNCTGTGPCTMTLNAATTVRADFTLKTWPLTVTLTGNGSVASNPAGISCGSQCTKAYDHGTMVTLTPTANTGAAFSAWGGACSGAGACVVTMDQSRTVTANFVPQQYAVSVSKPGTGTGTVGSNPAGISCGANCSASYPFGTAMTLTATSDPSSNFTGWGGACAGTGVCNLTVNAATAITANFTLKQWQLTVTLGGTGSGTVSSNPAGINCGSQCNKVYDHGTMVTLSAAVALGSTFVGWSGACTGTGACSVTMDQARNVGATFNPQSVTLVVSKGGSGAGVVTSVPNGIVCGANCSASYPYNTTVSLTATPAPNSTFTGWSGAGAACGLSNPCSVTLTATTTVVANFALIQLDVSLGGNGGGFVNSSPSGINNCGSGSASSSCSASYNSGTVVVLTATAESAVPSKLSTFVGWNGAGCSGTGTCTITMTAATSVVALFALRPNLAFVTSITTNAAFGGIGGGDAICANAANMNGLAGTYRALIGTSTVTPISRLGSASGWVRVDGRPLANSATDAAAGNFFHPLRITNAGVDLGDDSAWGTSTNTAAACLDFTSSVGSATVGRTSGVGGTGIYFGTVGCGASLRLYCFGIDRGAAVAIVPLTPRRLAFVTNGWTPGGGLASADAFCQSNATAAGLSGTFLALLATTTGSAASRFGTGGPRWTRMDGVPLAASASAMFGPALWDMVPNMNASQTQVFGNDGAWGGAPNLMITGTAASTCNNWTSNAGSGIGGRVGLSLLTNYFGLDTAIPCSAGYYGLTCLQQ